MVDRGRRVPADNHLHSEFSYDASMGDMELTCARAQQLGVPAVAFTEHVDFATWTPQDAAGAVAVDRVGHRHLAPFDVEGYLEEIERCRALFPQLRILTGIEAGEPHLFGASLAGLLGSWRPQRVLGSLHALVFDGTLRYASRGIPTLGAHEVMCRYLDEVYAMVAGSDVFEVLAHIDFVLRSWPYRQRYDERVYEEQFRSIFRLLASQGRVLEVNTKSPLASVQLLRWWYLSGGPAVSFGSDSHNPFDVAERFDLAVHVVESAGFRPGRDRYDFWRR